MYCVHIFIYTCLCINILMDVIILICMQVHIDLFACDYVCVYLLCLCLYICVYVCVCVCVSVHVYVGVCVCVRV